MLFGNKIYDKYSLSYSRKGKKNEYNAEIVYSCIHNYYFFLIENTKRDYIFNSLWHFNGFSDEEKCMIACENKIDELISNKYN